MESKIKDVEVKNAFRKVVLEKENKDALLGYHNQFDFANVKLCMIKYGVDTKTTTQICLIFELTSISKYLTKEVLSVIEVNNCFSEIVVSTNLNNITVKRLLSIILYGFGFQSVSEEFDKNSIIELKKTNNEFDLINPNCDNHEIELNLIDEYVNNKDVTSLSRKAHILDQLAHDGNAQALYIKGKCYLYGIGTTEDYVTAKKLLHRAAAKGYAKANALLGDLAFESGYYTEAYNHYTGIGATALSSKRQNNVVTILENKKNNVLTLIGSAIIFALILLFDLLMMTGNFCPSGCTHYPSGIISMFLSTVVFGLLIIKQFKQKYDSPRLFIFINIIVMFAFAFVALVL